MSLRRNARIYRVLFVAPILAALATSSLGCVDLAIMATSAMIRQAQNDQMIAQQRAIEAQRAAREQESLNALRRLEQRLDQSAPDDYTSDPPRSFAAGPNLNVNGVSSVSPFPTTE